MDVKDIEAILKRAGEGDLSVRVDENTAGPELKPLAQAANRLIEKLGKTTEMKNRADIMMKFNPLAISIINKNRARIFINKKYETLWRGTHDELMKKKMTDYDVTILSGEHYYACFETKKPTATQVLVKFPDGIKKYLTLNSIPLLDKNGDVDAAFFIFIEYTELQEKMDDIKKVEQRVDRILQENPYPLFTIDTALNLVLSNQAFLKLTGYSKDRAASLSMKDFKFQKNKGESVETTIRSKRRSQGESVIEFPAGTLTLEWYYIPLLDAEGNVESLLVVYNDITDRRRKEQEVQQLMESSKKQAEALSSSAVVLETGLAAIAKGDLSFNAPIAEGDPLIALKKDYNAAVASIRNLVIELGKSIHQMEMTTGDTSKSTQEISKSTEQVAISTQKSADGAKKQIEEIEKVSKDISDLSASIEEIASTSHSLMDHAQKAAADGNSAAELGKVATAKMQNVEKIAGESVAEITALTERMKEISNIVKMIADISSQTNLLALNAAIEAARAGEHGRGFAVVAGEVRNLAKESKTATGHIESLIQSIQTSSDKTAAAINSSYKEIQTGIESVNKTLETLTRITAESNVVAQGVTEITKATEDQAEATTRVMQGIEQTGTITRENQERMEDMAALAEETSASTEEIASATTELAGMAERLKTMMDAFKVR
ncbi:methyl-accepting chemotaxis protein [Methanoregula sp.]|jgi:methyl-accepting chemotaxis protein|uniref:methyl-accepting chemotaxis protein n=1 Tax=Methanoregula sp. TaxID=2052170 RepID=UPI003C131DB9